MAEGGELSWMTGPIELETAASGKAGAKGMFGAVKRAVAGGSLFMTEYTAKGGAGMVAFATKVPGQILPIEVSEQQSYMVHRGGYLCGLPGVSLEIGFQQKFSAGLFGGEGFILQKVLGDGPAWIELDGEVVDYDLAPGQEIMVHPGPRRDVRGGDRRSSSSASRASRTSCSAPTRCSSPSSPGRARCGCRRCRCRTSRPRSRRTSPPTTATAPAGSFTSATSTSAATTDDSAEACAA